MGELIEKRKKYLIKYRETKDKNALEFLVLSYIPSIESAVSKYENKGIELEDLISTGIIVTIETINKHIMINDIRSLSSYIIFHLNYELSKITDIEYEVKKDTISYDQYKLSHKNGEEHFFSDTIFEDILKDIRVEEIEKILKNFTQNEQIVLKSRFGLNNNLEYTQTELAELLDLSITRIQQIEAKAIRKLKHPYCSEKLKDFI